MKDSENLFMTVMPLRQEAIYNLIKENTMVKVSELSEKLGVTNMTIRRDLEKLENDGLIERTHGGAMISNKGIREPLFAQKSLLHKKEKEAIAKMAAGFIENHDTIFLNSGTTTLRIFPKITAKHVKVVTNNAFFPMEEVSDWVEVISTGGMFRKESFTYIGATALNTISQVFASRAFIGLDGFDAQYGMTTPVEPEALVNRKMIEHTHGEIIIVVDSSKIGKVSNFLVAPANAAQKVITDPGISLSHRKDLENLGIEVIICK